MVQRHDTTAFWLLVRGAATACVGGNQDIDNLFLASRSGSSSSSPVQRQVVVDEWAVFDWALEQRHIVVLEYLPQDFFFVVNIFRLVKGVFTTAQVNSRERFVVLESLIHQGNINQMR